MKPKTKSFFCFLVPEAFFLLLSYGTFAQVSRDSLAAAPPAGTPTSAQLSDFTQQAKDDVLDFAGHVEHIADKSYSEYLRKRYIGNALKLFADPDENTIEVSSVRRNEAVTRETVRVYLNRLLKLSYVTISVKWYDFRITNFVKGKDGNYYATATVFQQFLASNGNADIHGQVNDIVKKSIGVKLIRRQAYQGAQPITWWEIKLGDIHLEQTANE